MICGRIVDLKINRSNFPQKTTALQNKKQKTKKTKRKPEHKISFPTLTKNIKMQIHRSPLFQGEWYCTNGPRMCIILISDK